MAQKTGIAQGFLVIYVGNDLEFGAYPPKDRGVDHYGYLRDAPPGMLMWTNVRSFAVRHSRLIFYLSNAWRVLRPATSADTAPAPTDGRDRWIYDEGAFTRDQLDGHRRVLAALRDYARIRGVPVTVVIMPERDQVYGSLSDLPNRMLSLILSDLGMSVIDLLPKMREIAAQRPPLWHDGFQGHLSPEGHRFVAEILIDQLRQAVPGG